MSRRESEPDRSPAPTDATADATGTVIDADGVRAIARLACLDLSPSQVPELCEHFARILRFVEKLHEVDIDGIADDLHGERPLAAMRDDAADANAPGTGAAESWQQAIFDNAPAVHRNADRGDGMFFEVPRVL